MNQDDIYELLERAYESEDAEEIEELAERALELDPGNPEALMLKADLTEDDGERLPILEKALEKAREYLDEENLSEENLLEDDMGLVYLGILQRTAYTLFSLEEDDRSLKMVEELLRYDHEDLAMAKTLYYRILLEREEWTRVLEETMKDTVRGLGWIYAKMIATFMSGNKTGKSAANNEQLDKMLWYAIRMAPNVPFYMLGYFPDPVDDSEGEEDDFHFGLLFEGVCTISRDLLNWFSKATILFGLLTGRFGEESDDMKEILGALGGTSDYEMLVDKVANASDDGAVLDILAAGN